MKYSVRIKTKTNLNTFQNQFNLVQNTPNSITPRYMILFSLFAHFLPVMIKGIHHRRARNMLSMKICEATAQKPFMHAVVHKLICIIRKIDNARI